MGVSISLVSRVLSGSARSIGVPMETIHEVEETAKRMGYIPNRAAQALKGKSTHTIGVVVYDFKDPFFSDFVALLQEKLHSTGYSSILVGFTDRQIDERDLTPLRQHILDAVIILGSDFVETIHREIQVAPIFRIGHRREGEPTISYCPDEEKSAQALGDYLAEIGCKTTRIVQARIWNHNIRVDAMQRAFESRGITVIDRFESGIKPYFEAGLDFAEKHLDINNLPDVVVCTVDQIAIGVMRKLKEQGVRIPEQVRITGFDDIRFSRQVYPGLTTFCQPMGQVIDKIIKRIQAQDFRSSVEYMECPLVKRGSC